MLFRSSFPVTIAAQIQKDFHAQRQHAYDELYKGTEKTLSKLKVPRAARERVLGKLKNSLRQHKIIVDNMHTTVEGTRDKYATYQLASQIVIDLNDIILKDMSSNKIDWLMASMNYGDVKKLMGTIHDVTYSFTSYGEFAANQIAKQLGTKNEGPEYKWIKSAPAWVKTAIDYSQSLLQKLLNFTFENSKGVKSGLDLVMEGKYLTRTKDIVQALHDIDTPIESGAAVEFRKADMDKISWSTFRAIEKYSIFQGQSRVDAIRTAAQQDGIDPESIRIIVTGKQIGRAHV